MLRGPASEVSVNRQPKKFFSDRFFVIGAHYIVQSFPAVNVGSTPFSPDSTPSRVRGGERDRRCPLNAFEETNRQQQTHSPAGGEIEAFLRKWR